MERHSLIGERIVAAAPTLEVDRTDRPRRPRAVDGNGYPDGLILDEIPICSRIIAVVDAFDAMTSDRAYRTRNARRRSSRRTRAQRRHAVRSGRRRRLRPGARPPERRRRLVRHRGARRGAGVASGHGLVCSSAPFACGHPSHGVQPRRLVAAIAASVPAAIAAATPMVDLGTASSYAAISGASIGNTVSAAGAPHTTLRGESASPSPPSRPASPRAWSPARRNRQRRRGAGARRPRRRVRGDRRASGRRGAGRRARRPDGHAGPVHDRRRGVEHRHPDARRAAATRTRCSSSRSTGHWPSRRPVTSR